ncbi:hypothetical protein EWB00_009635 [Schistosoma japonicum]|uniref:Uncharacterized protein n=1 Tax=Schistosoma japonicum TaxID=6182 RepID=A0A4Z2DR15_SCHJA|nr:hypothetical protein EWB00_009635 [Schistosoma japonicum]
MTITFEQMKLCLQQQQQQFLASQEQMLESLVSKIAIQSRITPEEKGIELSLSVLSDSSTPPPSPTDITQPTMSQQPTASPHLTDTQPPTTYTEYHSTTPTMQTHTGVLSDSSTPPPSPTDITQPTMSQQPTASPHLTDTQPPTTYTEYHSTTPTMQTHTVITFSLKGVLYTNYGLTPYIWTNDLLNPLTVIYMNLSQSFCQLVLNSLHVDNYSTIEGVLANSMIELTLFNIIDINDNDFYNILLMGYNQINASSELQLFNVQTTKIISETITSTISTEDVKSLATTPKTTSTISIEDVKSMATTPKTTSTTKSTTYVTVPTDELFSDFSFEFFENTLPPVADKPTIGRITAIIFNADSFKPIEWLDELKLPTNSYRLNLTTQIQLLIIKSIRSADLQIAFSFKILSTIFNRVAIQLEFIYWGDDIQTYTDRSDIIDGIQIIMTVEMKSLKASLLSDEEIVKLFDEGLHRLNVTTGPTLLNIHFTRISDRITDTTTQTTRPSSMSTEIIIPIVINETRSYSTTYSSSTITKTIPTSSNGYS